MLQYKFCPVSALAPSHTAGGLARLFRVVGWVATSMALPGPESEGGKDAAEDHLRSIFDLCDEDGDGLVAVADLRRREEMCGYDKVRRPDEGRRYSE